MVMSEEERMWEALQEEDRMRKEENRICEDDLPPHTCQSCAIGYPNTRCPNYISYGIDCSGQSPLQHLKCTSCKRSCANLQSYAFDCCGVTAKTLFYRQEKNFFGNEKHIQATH